MYTKWSQSPPAHSIIFHQFSSLGSNRNIFLFLEAFIPLVLIHAINWMMDLEISLRFSKDVITAAQRV